MRLGFTYLQIKRDGMTHLIVIPLYPQFSISTSGSSLRLLEDIFESDPAFNDLKHSVIASWCAAPPSLCSCDVFSMHDPLVSNLQGTHNSRSIRCTGQREEM